MFLPGLEPVELLVVGVLHGGGVVVLSSYLLYSRSSCLVMLYKVVAWLC